ncbi:MAG: NUDIX domain-containing protein [Candidatus Pacebacteria bacterium]|nr:NUDIX domain-containing protein [Candidatus Paceibacterota bacterium]
MYNKKVKDRNHRNKIIKLIQSVNCYDKIEKEHITDTIKWINSDTEIFRIKKPATPIKHLVCFTVLYDVEKQKILLLEHKTSGLILPSGGHIEKEEMPYETVQRELQEELGINGEYIFKNWKIPFFVTQIETVGKTSGHIDVDLWYLLKGNSEKPIKTDTQDFQREFGKFNWYTLDEILKIPLNTLDLNMHRFVKKLKKVLYKK